jgi:hypothetical protein
LADSSETAAVAHACLRSIRDSIHQDADSPMFNRPTGHRRSLIHYRRSSIDLASCEQRRSGSAASSRIPSVSRCRLPPLPRYSPTGLLPMACPAARTGSTAGRRQSPLSAFSFPRRHHEDVKCSSAIVQIDLTHRDIRFVIVAVNHRFFL